eukprot:TRINITY_DN114485_c0_g1_i1.p2 TRINITY_DN114485_c0_g1~~TRINITY_DN114485_c0_g1_i1.p2  ORF type:complete len:167 (-),score=26.41 TRINITY_DN114485_c0_g1_i1:198-698(-)
MHDVEAGLSAAALAPKFHLGQMHQTVLDLISHGGSESSSSLAVAGTKVAAFELCFPASCSVAPAIGLNEDVAAGGSSPASSVCLSSTSCARSYEILKTAIHTANMDPTQKLVNHALPSGGATQPKCTASNRPMIISQKIIIALGSDETFCELLNLRPRFCTACLYA